VKLTHDREADAAKIYLAEDIPPAGVARSVVCDANLVGCSVVLDFDEQDRLLAIELLGASKLLPDALQA
jgi:uncharacterized protein YuzE